jgi:hypothetical protein
MVVRLQTENGEIKEYRTSYGEDWTPRGEYGYFKKFVTKCGMEWKKRPKKQNECTYLECAIYLEDKNQNIGLTDVFAFVFFEACIWLFLILEVPDMPRGTTPIFLGLLTLIVLVCFYDNSKAKKRFKELTEYRDKRSINGIRCREIYEEVKHWWQFWK